MLHLFATFLACFVGDVFLGDRECGREQDDAECGGIHRGRRASGGGAREATGSHQCPEHAVRHQETDRATLRRRRSPERHVSPLPVPEPPPRLITEHMADADT